MTDFMSHVARVCGRSFDNHDAFHRFSVEEPEAFWGCLVDWLGLEIEGERTPALVGDECETARFFPRARLSFTRNVLRAVMGGDDALPAVVSCFESGSRRELSR